MNDVEVIEELQHIKKNFMCLEDGKRNISSKKIAALNNSIIAVKKYHNVKNSFWAGFITCGIVATLYLVFFSIFN